MFRSTTLSGSTAVAFCVAALVLLPVHALRAQGSPAWQQRVAYSMEVRLIPETHRLEGRQRLVYENNSPDTLRQVFYHLYFNAFQPNSAMAARNRVLPDPDRRVVPRIFELGPDEIGLQRVASLTQDGAEVPFDVDDTVLRATLPRPIPPGSTAVFELAFEAQVPLQTRRSGRDNREGVDYSMTQWYPKIAAYDERGWHPDPYIGREFYAPFGTFDVRLTLPAPYVVGATGVLLNPDEVGHGYASSGPAGDVKPARRDSLTWHFRAENVHDFAWVADPEFIHEQFIEDGTTYHLLYLPDVASGWASMRQWLPALEAAFEAEVGPYPYPQYTVAQGGDGGMEYPMMTLITGRRSPRSLLSVTAHEFAHEWFYGALGTNESDYAWLDEGFTSYLESRALAALAGTVPSHQSAHLRVVRDLYDGVYEKPNTPADWFRTNRAYGTASYYAGESIVDLLGYVLSDSLRDAWLRTYYERFLFRHPNPYDVEKVAEDVSGLRLDWYFEQIANDALVADYAVRDFDVRRGPGGWAAAVTLEREGDLVLPVDLRITTEDRAEHWVTIPLDVMQGHKPVPAGWTVAAPWPWTEPRYEVRLELPERPVRVEIDPLGRTPEMDRLDNRNGLPLAAALLQPPEATWFTYGVGYRPLLQYAERFGPGLGVRARGSYLFDRHAAEATLSWWPQLPEVAGPGDGRWHDAFDYELAYGTPAGRPGSRVRIDVALTKHLGVFENRLEASWALGRFPTLARVKRTLRAGLVHQTAPSARAFDLGGGRLFPAASFAYTQLGYHVVGPQGFVRITGAFGGRIGAEGCGPGDECPAAGLAATRLLAEAERLHPVGPFQARATAKAGIGVSRLATHRLFRLGGADGESAWRSDAFRTAAAFSEDGGAPRHLVPVDDAGPVAYALAGSGAGGAGAGPAGRALLSGRLALEATPLPATAWLRPLSVELFSGSGILWQGASTPPPAAFPERLVADAGVAARYDLSRLAPLARWTAQSDVIRQLRLSLQLPLWASHPELVEAGQSAVAFRWLLGISIGS